MCGYRKKEKIESFTCIPVALWLIWCRSTVAASYHSIKLRWKVCVKKGPQCSYSYYQSLSISLTPFLSISLNVCISNMPDCMCVCFRFELMSICVPTAILTHLENCLHFFLGSPLHSFFTSFPILHLNRKSCMKCIPFSWFCSFSFWLFVSPIRTLKRCNDFQFIIFRCCCLATWTQTIMIFPVLYLAMEKKPINDRNECVICPRWATESGIG